MKSKIIIVPVVNPMAFRLRSRVNPVDKQDLNRVFLENEKGTVTERIAFSLWKNSI